MVSSTLGGSTMTGWKRRSSAASFSTCLRYSSSVVAPTTCSSPRASAGLSMLLASTAPSAAPAPTMVWSSSMKVMKRPSASVSSFTTALSRSSNSPRYLAPASNWPMSSATISLCRSESGTSPSTIRWASPSTMAVLPTPGSPIRTGLFLVRRERTCMTRRTSSSRPMTGSSFPARAWSVRLRVKRCSAWYFSSGLWSVTRWAPRTASRAVRSSLAERLAPLRSSRAVVPFTSLSASNRCSVEMNASPSDLASASALSKTWCSSRLKEGSAPPLWVGKRSSSRSTASRNWVTFNPAFCSSGWTIPSSCVRRTAKRWASLTTGLPRERASSPASRNASCPLMVNRSGRIIQASSHKKFTKAYKTTSYRVARDVPV